MSAEAREESPTAKQPVRGMALGVILGDTLGAPHEFSHSIPVSNYTGVLEFPFSHQSRHHGRRNGVKGQATDDTEMTIALFASIVNHGWRYEPKTAAKAYITWASSAPFGMGRNTRELFAKIKKVESYSARWKKKFVDTPQVNWTQSNGCLMRASPLAIIPDVQDAVLAAIADCKLSNPHPVCVASCAVYVMLIHELIYRPDITYEELSTIALKQAPVGEVKDTIEQALTSLPRDVTSSKGWVLHALWCSVRAMKMSFVSGASFRTIIDWVIRLGGDTDTNGAIAGALIGARFGFTEMVSDKILATNARVAIYADPSQGELDRPKEYQSSRLLHLATISEEKLPIP